MRILFVGMPDSIHTARWITQLADQGWEIYLFPSQPANLHSFFHHITVFAPLLCYSVKRVRHVHFIHWTGLFAFFDKLTALVRGGRSQFFWKLALFLIILVLKPDIVQSLEIQHAGYLTLAVRNRFKSGFPKWILTNWGSDIYLFGRLPAHEKKIKEALAKCDYYSAECHRDIDIALQKGFKGEVLPVLPNAGGINIKLAKSLRESGKISERRIIILKGYQNWAGRALVAIRALALCADVLHGYTLMIYSASLDVKISAMLFSQDTGISVGFIPQCSHEEMLRWFGRARIYIGLSISDAISTSMLEAIVMGAFPIQSNTSCANEWIMDGRGGFIVPAEDPEVISEAIRKSIVNDALVDEADENNKRLVWDRIDEAVVAPQVIEMYKRLLVEKG